MCAGLARCTRSSSGASTGILRARALAVGTSLSPPSRRAGSLDDPRAPGFAVHRGKGCGRGRLPGAAIVARLRTALRLGVGADVVVGACAASKRTRETL